MNKPKEKWRKDAVIKIKTLLEITKTKDGEINKEKLINVSIDKGYVENSTSFEKTKQGTKELLKFIKDELYLK